MKDRRTKIVCTLGPAVDSKAKVKSLIDAGMNVARINCSHGDWATRRKWVKWIEELQPKVDPIGLLIDLQGPKFRIGEIPGGEIRIRAGASLTLGHKKGKSTLTVPNPRMWAAIKPGVRLMIGDGGVEIKAVKKQGETIACTALCGGTVRSRQGLTLVGKSFDVPSITEQDKEDLKHALNVGADFIALSYVRRAKDIKELRRLIDRKDKAVKVVAKIETSEALDQIEEIAQAADVLMVARGDLGLQMPLEDVPLAQKRIINVGNAFAKPVITATQMLESMIASPRPTRAEATDVANAILDGTDAVMLSGETATGAYPLDAVKTMSRIAVRAEQSIDAFIESGRLEDLETDSVARAAVAISEGLRTAAILVSTTSGLTPRMVSRYRPELPLLCVCWSKKTHRQMSVVWGVEAVYASLPKGTDEAVKATIDAFKRLKRVKPGEKVVVTAGVPAGVPGNTNMILVRTV